MEISKDRIDKADATKPQGRITALKAVEGTNAHEINSKQHKANVAQIKRLERMDKEVKRLNIAYGSNLNLQQMVRRCPTAKVYGKGMVKGYRLLFKGTQGNAYATIEPFKGGNVPVLVWELKPEDEKALDFYEGFPSFYYKKDLKVELEGGEIITAMVYIMTNKIKDRIHINLPSQSYLKIVEAGYIAASFDIRFIEEALKISAEALSDNELNNI